MINEYQHASLLFSHTLHFQDFRQSITLLSSFGYPRMPSRVFAFSASRSQESDWMHFFRSGDSSRAVRSLADIEPLNCKFRG
jgi:hypothetical protein